MRGKVPSGVDPFLSILTSRKWTESLKINCPSVGFCAVMDRRTGLTRVWARTRWGFLDNLEDDHRFPLRDFGLAVRRNAQINPTIDWTDQCFEKGSFKELHVGNDFHYLDTMLDGLLSMIGNGLGTISLYVLVTWAKPILELGESGFENEVQDIPRWRTRCVKINYPSVGFVQFWLCEKSLDGLVCG